MSQRADRHVDEDRAKGAVESPPDDGNAATVEDQGVPKEQIAVTEDAVNANADEIANAEHVLGADEDGTPG